MLCTPPTPSTTTTTKEFGRPICLTISLVLITADTNLCLCSEYDWRAGGRPVRPGIGGGGIHVLGGIIMTDIVPLRYRSKWFGIVYVLLEPF